jgi:adenine-specific DNA-methyltransferase
LDYDPHLDPQLVWAGKKEHSSFEVPTVSLHVHERIDPHTIIDAVRKRNGNGLPVQPSLFERKEENPPLREAIDFYRHAHGWSNRMIAGDSLLVMNSLLEKEGMAGQVQMAYVDPPYGKTYNSNFQPFTNKRDVKDGKDEDLTQEPEMIRAFRDTWELGLHSYLNYLHDRLLLTRDLLAESGSCFVQISDENLHEVRCLLDELFKPTNFCGLVWYRTTGGQSASLLSSSGDYLIWYAKDKEKARLKFRQPTSIKHGGRGGSGQYNYVEPLDGSAEPRPMTEEELDDLDSIPDNLRVLAHDTVYSQGSASDPNERFYSWRGQVYECPPNNHWKPGVKSGGMARLALANRLMLVGNTLRYKRYLDDYPVVEIDNVWNDTAISGFGRKKQYVVETSPKVIERCIAMTTDPGDLVFDPTCGSGTTAFVAEKWGRRWITCDTSRVAVTLAKQRLVTAVFDFYELAHPEEGIGSGLRYKSVPHITLGSIANNLELKEGMSQANVDAIVTKYAEQEKLFDQPYQDKTRTRVSGPFTMEAVPAPTVRSLEDIDVGSPETPSASEKIQQSLADFRHAATPLLDASVSRSGPTLRHTEWRDELLKTGLRGKSGNHIDFSRVEPLSGTRWLHADAETKGVKPERVVISFGPEHSLLDPRQVESAWQEARTLIPRPAMIVFAAFEFDPQAAKEIDDLTKDKTGMTFLSAQMNADLLTADLKKKRASNQSFWLVGRPDVDLRQVKSGDHKGKWEVEVQGFDYYNTRTGTIDSGDTSRIAMWLLDTDYDGRSLYPRQVFFPLADEDGGWARLAKNLKAEIDPELIEAYRDTVSLPFEPGQYKTIAVKVIDDRGIESLKVVEVK